jgi:hypothetical protein
VTESGAEKERDLSRLVVSRAGRLVSNDPAAPGPGRPPRHGRVPRHRRPLRPRPGWTATTTLNRGRLGDALRACARGIHPLQAGTGLLIDCGSWLHRDDFTGRFITAGTSISDGLTLLAATDWEAAVAALHAGELPASGGERRILLLAASIAGGIPVNLNDILPGIDRRNASLVVRAIVHAAGQASHVTTEPDGR